MSIYTSIIRPALFHLPAETVHELGIEALRLGLAGFAAPKHHIYNEFGVIERFGLRFANPLGIAAGFDKNAVVVNPLEKLGFGFVEVGTVTYDPQPGNPKPRMFRLPADEALINRLGFNNDGAAKVADRLKSLKRNCVVGVNIGKNKDVPNEEATENYLKCFDLIHAHADYVAVNISSPNTPNLRELQKADSLGELLGELQKRNQELSGANPMKPLLVKIAPDLTSGEVESIVEIALRYELAGIIATNTTISRESLKTNNVSSLGAGGLSGRPLTKRSTEVVSEIHRYSKGRIPIVGVGGIFDAQDAFDKIAAGASLVQAYTGFVYGGPYFARDVNAGLGNILKARGFSTLDEAVGSNVKM
ncbi:MAG: quinone-dependent dihydroorotate dehydrogenase [Pyrinomonadaceae bacterium]